MVRDNIDKSKARSHEAAQITAASQRQADQDWTAVDLHEYRVILFRRRRIVIATFLLVFALGLLHTLTRRPVYESTTKIVVVAGSSSPSNMGDEIRLMDDLRALTRSRSVDTQVEVISSPDVLNEAFKGLSPKLRSAGFRSTEMPGWAYRVAAKKDTDVIAITGRAYQPQAAAELANSIAGTYFDRDLSKNCQATNQVRKYVKEEMAAVERELVLANERLSQFKQKTGLIAPETQLSEGAEHIARLRIENDNTLAQLESSRTETKAIEEDLARQQENVVTSATVTKNPRFVDAVARIDQLYSQRSAMLQKYTPQSREIKNLESQIRDEQTRLGQVAETIVSAETNARNPIRDAVLKRYSENLAATAALTSRVKSLNRTLNARKAEFEALPEQERVLANLVEKVALLRETFRMLSQKYYALQISERSVVPKGQMISQALPSSVPAYPNVKKNIVLFMLLAAMVSVAAAAAIERLDVRLNDQQFIEDVSGVPTLAVVPMIQKIDARIISNRGRDPVLLESFRILRNNIAFSAVDRDMRLLAVTSSGPSEGKSTVASNLAMAIAMDGKRVLLVDCDLRRPRLHKILNVSRDVGFSNVVTGAVPLEDAVVSTSVENLYCLPSGPIPPNPAEFLSSEHSRQFFRQVAERYDMVVVDCPPSVGLSDVQVISTLVDGLVMVASMGETLKPHLLLALRVLDQVDAPLIGGVLNKMDVHSQGYYSYYSYAYRYRSTADEDNAGSDDKGNSDKLATAGSSSRAKRNGDKRSSADQRKDRAA
ncbi:MAG: polysaccharide biosynthesis tyrosine autokinase [Armatimonadetes bacterium]|nr:polysaccharide biosynthesis tyrosine autokinase [Armatimonadota bacterium]